MVELGHSLGVPVLYDQGSGAMRALAPLGLQEDPSVEESVASGADVVCFSGDKLLGGPQAGILLGKKEQIAAMRSHPLLRALRPDKLSLAALEATLRLYRDEKQAARLVPTVAMLLCTEEELQARAARLCALLEGVPAQISITAVEGQVGGGSAPGHPLPSVAVALLPERLSVDALAARLREGALPLVGRIAQQQLLLDVRTLDDTELEPAAAALRAAFAEEERA